MSFAKEALPFVLPVALLAVVLLVVGRPRAATVAAVVALALLLFFRIPARQPEGDPKAVLAPANGVITAVDLVEEPAVGPGSWRRVVTFLSVFDVHVQRAPLAGQVVTTRYTEGRKLAAFREAAGEVNENNLAVLRTASGDTFAVKQIAGLLARRVVSYLAPGDRVERGGIIGLIKFGSRVDLYLPESYELLVEIGQRVREGATPMALPAASTEAPDPRTAS